MLAAWKLGGWQRMIGRRPNADDLIVPSRQGACRSVNHGLKRFHEDLERVGQRPRRQHDLRRSFITLARTDGARKDVLEVITHGSRGDIVDVYMSLPWQLLCDEVAKLRLELRAGAVVALRKPSKAVGGGRGFGTGLGTVAARAVDETRKSPEGFAFRAGPTCGVDGT